MRKKTKFINSLENEDNRAFFISSEEVGAIWECKHEIRVKKGYIFNDLKKENISFLHSNAVSTKEFVKEIICKFSNSKTKTKSITEDTKALKKIYSRSEPGTNKDKINIYSNFSLLFLNFINMQLTKQKIQHFVERFGLLGNDSRSSEYQENFFPPKDLSSRIEPFILWEYEQWHLRFAYNLWKEITKTKKNQNNKNLLSYFNYKNSSFYDLIISSNSSSNFPKIFNLYDKEKKKWPITENHDYLLKAAKAIVGTLIQDHLEHRVSFPINFSDFNHPTPIFQTDSLIAILWLQLLNYVRNETNEKKIQKCKNKNCEYEFIKISKNKEFCSNQCKIDHFNYKSKKKRNKWK